MADGPPAIASALVVGDFARVYDDSQQRWLDDGKVLEVMDAGVRVCFANGTVDCVLPPEWLKRLEPVIVNVYDLGPKPNAVKSLNNALRLVGAGAYHAGVEVYGLEYSFGGPTTNSTPPEQTGVFSDEPRQCASHRYRESVALGHTALTQPEVRALYQRMKPEWLAWSYDLTRKNCCSFCNDFCRHIGVQNSLPAWITRLPNAGAAVDNVVDQGKLARHEATTAPPQLGDVARGLAAVSERAAETLSSRPKPRGADAHLLLDRFASYQRIEDSRMSSVLQGGGEAHMR